MTVELDATEISRHLLKSSIVLPTKPGPFAFRHPEWIPGIHGPSEQIRNIGGLTVYGADGKRIDWRRDAEQLTLFHVDVPEGNESIRIELTYLANQPTRVSTGVDSFGNADVLAINIHTAIMYPDGKDLRELPVEAAIRLPAGFTPATALLTKSATAERVVFERCTVETLVDSPLIAGRNYRNLAVEVEGFPDTHYHFVSESSQALEFDEQTEQHYLRLMNEAFALFGSAPFSKYDFLVVCSDKIPGMGLEHHESSLNGIDERALVDEDKRKGRAVYLLAHELVHAWCGKYRRPAGMYRGDYHTPKQTQGLWIYEGLTQYLGHVLTTRAGMLTFDEHRQRTAARIGYLANRTGRQWRPLVDTAVAAYTLRGGSASWTDLRRSQDYYDEGAFFWLEADSILRSRSKGKVSLDDFCQAFFRYDPKYPKVKPFEVAEIVGILNDLQEFDWQGLIERRIRTPQTEMSLAGLRMAGYEFTLVEEKPDYIKSMEKEREYLSAEYSLGLGIKKDGQIRGVVPNGVADKAGVADGVKVLGVNGLKYSEKRLEDGLKTCMTTGEIELLVEEGEAYRTIQLQYKGGPKYPSLTSNSADDLFQQICTPRQKSP